MFAVGAANFGFPGSLPWYLPLGVICGFAAVAFSRALYWVEDQFERLPFDALWWPALGGLGVGIVALFVPRVLGVGYGTLSDLLNARLALEVVAVIMIAKAAALLVSLGSGTSGGLLAPMFTVGAALGGLYADLVNRLAPGAHLSPGAFALVSMAAMFGSAARAPFTLIVFAFELTRNYDSVLPLMLAVVVAHGIALVFMKNSIMTEKLARRGLRVHQEYEVDAFHQAVVGDFMDPRPAVVPAAAPIGELARRISAGDVGLTRHQALLLVDEQGSLAGILTRGDLVRALAGDPSGSLTALEAGRADPHVAYPDETVGEALERMLALGCGRLPVIDRDLPKKVVGYLGRASILEAQRRRMLENGVREPGWWSRRGDTS
jgi:CBS domain-containing protein